ncbi:MAG: hypothetical protein M3P93_06245 [Actinomycetota bacterium]|nr:hypothetical protein [Actinomycetota bacterium]
MVRWLLLLIALTLVARWLFPRRPVPWSVPVMVGLTIVGVRGAAWWLGQE